MPIVIRDQHLDAPGEDDVQRVSVLARVHDERVARKAAMLHEAEQGLELRVGERRKQRHVFQELGMEPELDSHVGRLLFELIVSGRPSVRTPLGA